MQIEGNIWEHSNCSEERDNSSNTTTCWIRNSSGKQISGSRSFSFLAQEARPPESNGKEWRDACPRQTWPFFPSFSWDHGGLGTLAISDVLVSMALDPGDPKAIVNILSKFEPLTNIELRLQNNTHILSGTMTLNMVVLDHHPEITEQRWARTRSCEMFACVSFFFYGKL